MIRHWLRTSAPAGSGGSRSTPSAASRPAIVAVVVTSVKFVDGAWLVVLLIPILVAMMLFIRREYDAQATELQVRDDLVSRARTASSASSSRSTASTAPSSRR